MDEIAGRTDPGKRRQSNEDAFLADADLQLLVVADGMGGHRAGEVASQVVIDTVGGFVRSSESDRQITWPFGLDVSVSFEANQLRNAVHLANQRVRFDAQRQPEHEGMGSTVVVARIRGDQLVHCNVGDSRLYVFRDGVLQQLSTDHSWVASMIRAGSSPESLEGHPMRHMLTQALGSEDTPEVTISTTRLEDDDLLLLCTDGLHGAIGDDGIAGVLREGGHDLDSVAEALIDAANAAGGPDNVTVVLAWHHQEADEGRG